MLRGKCRRRCRDVSSRAHTGRPDQYCPVLQCVGATSGGAASHHCICTNMSCVPKCVRRSRWTGNWREYTGTCCKSAELQLAIFRIKATQVPTVYIRQCRARPAMPIHHLTEGIPGTGTPDDIMIDLARPCCRNQPLAIIDAEGPQEPTRTQSIVATVHVHVARQQLSCLLPHSAAKAPEAFRPSSRLP